MYLAISALIVSIKAIQVDQIVTPVISLSPLSNTLNFELDLEDNNVITDNEEEITILDNIEVIINDNENEVEIEVIDLTFNTGHNKKKINISKPIETTNIISKIRKILYNSMFNYWKDINKVGMLACLLDPRFKKLRFVKQRTRDQVIDELKDLYEDAQFDYRQLNPITNTNHVISTAENTSTKRKSILDIIYASSNEPVDSTEEIDKYFELNEVGKETNPLEWWKLHEKRFPILASIARKYLCICATSVPSERLFSDVGNNITNKRTNLDPDLVEKMLFLREILMF